MRQRRDKTTTASSLWPAPFTLRCCAPATRGPTRLAPCSQAARNSARSPTRLVAQLCYMRRINCPKRERRGSDQNSRHRTGGTA